MTSSAEARPTLLDAKARQGAELAVEGDPYRHLFRARRLAVGDALRVVDGHGGAWSARVDSVGSKRALVRVGAAEPSLESLLRLELLVALPRPQRAAWLVEKATELGVAAIRFLHTERTVRDAGRGDLERWRRVAAAALEQCGRARLPEVSGPHDWKDLPDLLAPCTRRWVLDPGAPPLAAPASAPGSSVAALIGPEGGWTAPERATFATLSCHPASLGPRTLRTETAALAAVVLLAAPGGLRVESGGGGGAKPPVAPGCVDTPGGGG